MNGDQVSFTCQHCGETQSLQDDPPVEQAQQTTQKEHVPPESVEVFQTGEEFRPLDPTLTTRCPKCFHMQKPTVFCVRCGLDISKAELYKENWLPNTAHREQEWQEALVLWQSIEDNPSKQPPHNSFLTYCTENNLLDLASRQYRERLAEHPDEAQTAYYFKETATRMETMAMAGLQAENWLKNFAEKVQIFRRILVIIAVLLCLIGFSVFIWISTSPGQPAGLGF